MVQQQVEFLQNSQSAMIFGIREGPKAILWWALAHNWQRRNYKFSPIFQHHQHLERFEKSSTTLKMNF